MPFLTENARPYKQGGELSSCLRSCDSAAHVLVRRPEGQERVRESCHHADNNTYMIRILAFPAFPERSVSSSVFLHRRKDIPITTTLIAASGQSLVHE